MSAYLTIKVLGVVSAFVGPLPDWETCTKYLPDFEKRTDAVWKKPDLLADMEKRYSGVKRTDITHECTETKPEIGQK